MDDHQFDHIIKKKVGEYEEPGFDPTALAALHHQMAATAMVWPWYSRYSTELVIGTSIILSTLLILWSQWFLSNQNRQDLGGRLRDLESQNQQIEMLSDEIKELKLLTPDTIRIIEIRKENPLLYASLMQKIADLESTVKDLNENLNLGSPKDPEITYQYPVSESVYTLKSPSQSLFLQRRLSPRQKNRESLRVKSQDESFVDNQKEVKLSTATIREIEKHYRNGIGIKVGPMVEFSLGNYEIGSGKIDFTAGILGDFILSPSLSLETGIKYAHRFYDISDPDALSQKTFPDTDNTLGTLTMADIDSWILEIPLNLKYRHPISMKSHWYAGLGYSTQFYTRQVMEYEYQIDSNPAANITTAYSQDSFKSYPGFINLSLGLSHQLKNRKILETSLYYQHGLGARGIEEVNGGFLGARGVYWFTIR